MCVNFFLIKRKHTGNDLKKKKSDFFEKICFPRNSTDFVLPSLNSLTVSFSISIFVTLKKTNITVTSSCLLHKTFSFL